MRSLIFSVFIIIISGCTPKTSDNPTDIKTNDEVVQQTKTKVQVKPLEFSKPLREAIYFSSSLEREALKLIYKNNSLQKLSLFSVLSYIVEINTGAKKSVPYGLDCGKFEVQRDVNTIKIFKSCVKPAVELVKIKILNEELLYEIEFRIREWASVVGLPVSLTGEDVVCQMKLKDKKLSRLSCDHWSYLFNESPTSSTVIKTKEFVFERDAAKQFVIKGGFFKELIENKKIDIVVPLEGKIKIIEKEIKVIDEFAQKIKEIESGQKNEEKQAIKNEGVSEEGAKEVSQDNSQENIQDNNQESSQEINPEDRQVPEPVDQQNQQEGGSRGRRGR